MRKLVRILLTAAAFVVTITVFKHFGTIIQGPGLGQILMMVVLALIGYVYGVMES